VPHFNALAGMIPCQYLHKWYSAKNYILWATLPQKISPCGIFNHLYVMRTESHRIREITQTWRLLHRSMSFKVTEFGTNRKLICDFLLVINTNLPPILHRFRDSLRQVQNRYICLPLLRLTPSRRRGSPGTISVKFWPRYQMA